MDQEPRIPEPSAPESPPSERTDAEVKRTVRDAAREGADTAGLDEALAASDDSLAEAHHMAEEADEHIREARLEVDRDPEMNPDKGQQFYESGSEGEELDDQSIAPPG